jgi:seryl-tRNA synthetase
MSALFLAGALCAGAFAAVPAEAAKLGPYFPMPAAFPLNGTGKDALLKIQAKWLNDGLGNLEKARKETAAALEKGKAENARPEQIAPLEEKLKTLEADIEATKEEIAIEDKDMAPKEEQAERKRLFLLNVNQWIVELGRQATEQLKIAILKDGAEAEAAQNRHIQLLDMADALEKAKRDISVESWASTR